MNQNPKISVIVPVYNSEKYLKRCIQSVLRQSFSEFEILIVNDGSSDKSGKVCNAFANRDSRIRVFHQNNQGVSVARNTGLDNARGMYICFLDCDDWLPRKSLEILYGTIIKDKSDIVVGAASVIGLRKNSTNQYIVDTSIDANHKYELFDHLDILRAPWAKLYKNSLISMHNIRFLPGITRGEDTVFLWQYLQKCQSVTLIHDKVYYYSAIILNNSSKNYDSNYSSYMKFVVDELNNALCNCKIDREKEKMIITSLAINECCGCLNYLERFVQKYAKDDFTREAKKIVRIFGCYVTENCFETYSTRNQEKYLSYKNDLPGVVERIYGNQRKKNLFFTNIRDVLCKIKCFFVYVLNWGYHE